MVRQRGRAATLVCDGMLCDLVVLVRHSRWAVQKSGAFIF